jgi:hypothetical protein
MAMSTLERQFTNSVGSPDQVREELSRFSKDVNLLALRRRELIKQYPNKWVAFYSGEVISIAENLNDLLRGIDKKGLPRDTVVVQHLSIEKIKMIL